MEELLAVNDYETFPELREGVINASLEKRAVKLFGYMFGISSFAAGLSVLFSLMVEFCFIFRSYVWKAMNLSWHMLIRSSKVPTLSPSRFFWRCLLSHHCRYDDVPSSQRRQRRCPEYFSAEGLGFDCLQLWPSLCNDPGCSWLNARPTPPSLFVLIRRPDATISHPRPVELFRYLIPGDLPW